MSLASEYSNEKFKMFMRATEHYVKTAHLCLEGKNILEEMEEKND